MIDSELKKQILERNELRESVRLPLLDDQELDRLRSARSMRVLERTFASERARFPLLPKGAGGWFSGVGRWVQARRQVREELRQGQHLQFILEEIGFRLASDQADAQGQTRYIRLDEAAPMVIDDLASLLGEYGWQRDADRQASFFNEHTGEIVKLEASRSGTSIHHCKRLTS
jgi:hypothetical protein